MPVDAFGYRSLTLDELIEALTDIRQIVGPGAPVPVWVQGQAVYKPVKNVIMNGLGRIILEVHHG